MAEQEVGLLRQQLRAARQALAKAQTDNKKLWRQQDTQVFSTPSVAMRRDTVTTGNSHKSHLVSRMSLI